MSALPPQIAERAVEWLTARTLGDGDSVVGDLHEEFLDRVATHGLRNARRWYIAQAGALATACLIARIRSGRRRAFNPDPAHGRHMDEFRQNLRFSMRMLATRRALSAVMIVTIGAAIAVTVTMFAVVDAVLIRPLPFPSSERVVRLGSTFSNGTSFDFVPYLDVADYRRDAKAFTAVSAFTTWQGAVRIDDRTEVAQGASVDDAFATVLSLRVQRGRPFTQADFVVGGPSVALITDRLWASRFGRDPSIVGRALDIDERPRTIVGILESREYSFPTADLAVLVPMRVRPNSGQSNRSCRCFSSIGLLAPGVPLARGRAELSEITARIDTQLGRSRVVAKLQVTTLRDAVVGEARETLLLLAMMVAAVLLVACVNVASLLLGHAYSRGRELAVRAALGGSVGRIRRLLVTETMVLAAIGSALGTAAAPILSHLLLALYPGGLPRGSEVAVGPRVLIVSLILTFIAGSLTCWPVARRLSRVNLTDDLRAGGGAGRSRTSRHRGAALVSGQIALSVVLVFAAALLLRTFAELSRVEPGFDAANLLTFRVDVPARRYASGQSVTQLLDRTRESIAAIPNVRSVAFTSYLPLGGGAFFDDFVREEIGDRQAENPKAAVAMISTGYEVAMGARIVRGRAFRAADDSLGAPVAIINEELARSAFPDVDPIGRTISWAGLPHRTIVGIMANMRSRALWEKPYSELFIPSAQEARWSYYMTVRTERDPASSMPAIRRIIRDVDAALPVEEVGTMSDRLASARAPQRFRATLISVLGGIGLLLAVLGVYGVMANAVAQQRREIGIRMALGETSARVRWLVMAGAMRIATAGAVMGLIVSLGAGKWLSTFLVGVKANDPLMLGLSSAVLVCAALAAAYLPARRASNIDPAIALRME